MDHIDGGELTKDQFVERFFTEMDTEVDTTIDELDDNDVQHIESSINHVTNGCENEDIEIPMKGKEKRRSKLTEFGTSQSAKRKNESAKRELTSIVRQVFTDLQTFLITNPQITITDKKFVFFVARQNR